MDQADIRTDYDDAASGDDQTSLQERAENLRFKLLSCVLNVRMKFQDMGCQTAHLADPDSPLVYLSVQSGGVIQDFRLTVPYDETGCGKHIVLSGNHDGSSSFFRLYDDDGFIPISRFEDLSTAITEHIVADGHLKAQIQGYKRKFSESPSP